jgi:hypothetical protein
MYSIDLKGQWDFTYGRDGDCPAAITCDRTIRLPGSLQDQGHGDPVSLDTPWTMQVVGTGWVTDARYAPHLKGGVLRMPFWLQPETWFAGPAWYQREVIIPDDWTGRRVLLFLERPHIRTTVWVDEREIGSQNSLAAPHQYDLGLGISPGKHTLTIRVDNRLQPDIGANSHSVTDHTQTNWNGIVGEIRLESVTPVWFEDVQVYSDIAARKVRLQIVLANHGGAAGGGMLSVDGVEHEVSWSGHGASLTLWHQLPPDASLWDEFHPGLHRLELSLHSGEGTTTKTVSYGLREIRADGTQFTINGRKTFLRGTLECAVFPRTGYPSTDPAEWRKILLLIRAHGFNHIRFHSWCPPEAAFLAADELGLYLQVECSSWAQFSTTLGDGREVDDWLYAEGKALIKAYGNHPSFVLMAYGNEPGGAYGEYLSRWVEYWKSEEPRRLHTGAAGWPSLPGNDFDNMPEPRIQQWGEGSRSRLDSLPPSTTADYSLFVSATPRPIVSHEIGQRCVYPDFTEIPKYTGCLKARNFEVFQETLVANHMGDQAADFLQASGRLQILIYREEIESALRTKGFGGFHLLQANDFPGQGTSLVGWLNPFWESKGYVTPAEFRRFNGPTVLLARLPRRVFSQADELDASIEVAHFGPAPLDALCTEWEIRDVRGTIVREGRLPEAVVPVDNGIALGNVRVSLEKFPSPAKYHLVVRRQDIENDWDFWVYPCSGISLEPPPFPVTDSVDLAIALASKGGTVLFVPPAERVRGEVGLGFASVFWNTAWTSQQLPHTLGILCDPGHSAFAQFPTEFHTNWQWWEVINRGAALVLDGLPPVLHPLVQVIDDWFTNRRLGLVFEARLGAGRIVVTGADLLYTLHLRPAARQFRASLVNYMNSAAFQPAHEISEAQLRGLLKP